MTPRQPVTATPYALRALNLTTNGLAAGTAHTTEKPFPRCRQLDIGTPMIGAIFRVTSQGNEFIRKPPSRRRGVGEGAEMDDLPRQPEHSASEWRQVGARHRQDIQVVRRRRIADGPRESPKRHSAVPHSTDAEREKRLNRSGTAPLDQHAGIVRRLALSGRDPAGVPRRAHEW